MMWPHEMRKRRRDGKGDCARTAPSVREEGFVFYFFTLLQHFEAFHRVGREEGSLHLAHSLCVREMMESESAFLLSERGY